MYMGKPGKPSSLRKFLEKWKGKEYTEEEAKMTNIKKCERVGCTLMIDHERKDGGGFRAKIVGISRRDPNIPTMPVTYTEVPKWILEEKSKQVPPPQRPQAALAGGPPKAEEDLGF